MFCNITLFCRTDSLSSIHLKNLKCYLDSKNIVKLGQMLAVKGIVFELKSSKPDFFLYIFSHTSYVVSPKTFINTNLNSPFV